MIEETIRLEFNYIFPEDERLTVLECLGKISSETLIHAIGFFNKTPQPNFDNFFSNPKIGDNIIKRVNVYCYENKIDRKPIVISRETGLRISEIILANKDILMNDDNISNSDLDELYLFKAILLVNEELNSKFNGTVLDTENNIEKFAKVMIALFFPSSDLGLYKDFNYELVKLIFTTFYRVKVLLKFFRSKNEYLFFEDSLLKYFKLNSTDEFLVELRKLFMLLLNLKKDNNFKFSLGENVSKDFINSLISPNVVEDDDYSHLKNFPIYKIDNDTYSIIDFFFVVDKFFKSIRFVLKNSFNKKYDLKKDSRKFFQVFNTEFSEKFLMRKVLDTIFDKKMYFKLDNNTDYKSFPDYYVRKNNNVFIFEFKDILIAKDIKSSADIDKILKTFKSKLLVENGKDIGIGQLASHIASIMNNDFKYDSYVNKRNNITIYPILIVGDRIFETPGINYILNQWYLEVIKTKLKDKFNPDLIKNLTLIDLDTLIIGLEYFKMSNDNFKSIIDSHLRKMTRERKPHGNNQKEIENSIRKNISTQLTPISSREISSVFPKKSFMKYLLE